MVAMALIDPEGLTVLGGGEDAVIEYGFRTYLHGFSIIVTRIHVQR